MTPVIGDDGEVRIGRDGVQAGWLWAGGLAALGGGGITGWYLGFLPNLFLLYGCTLVLGAFVPAISLLRRTGAVEVVLDRSGIRATDRRGGEFTRTWSDVLEVGAGGLGRTIAFLNPGFLVVVRPEGRPWETPGPNAPFVVLLPVFGRAAQRRALRQLQDACRRHDVAFNLDVIRMQEQPRPGSPLRTDRTRTGDDLSRG